MTTNVKYQAFNIRASLLYILKLCQIIHKINIFLLVVISIIYQSLFMSSYILNYQIFIL